MSMSRRNLLHVGGGVLAAGALAPLAPTLPPASAATARFPGDPGVGKVYYGAIIRQDRDVAAWEASLGRRLGSRRNFLGSGATAGLLKRARQDVAAGRFSVLSIKPPGSWQDVAQGRHNGWVDTLLGGLAAINAPVSLTVNHEPENDVSGAENSPAWYLRMTEFLVARAAARAPKVNVTQIFMQWTFDPKSGRRPADWLAPSVRVFGMDAYNYWLPGGKVVWSSFGTMVGRAQEWAGGRPVVVGEYGCRTDQSQPGRAAAWMADALTYASTHDVVAMCYYDYAPAGQAHPFTLDAERLAAFKTCLKDPRSVSLVG